MNFTAIAPLFQTDAYKLGHLQQYGLAGNVTGVYSNYTNRGSRIADIGAVVHFGLQAFLERYTDSFRVFFDAEEDEVCAAYEARLARILGPNTIGSAHIRALHRLGFLPLRFCAVPEGTAVPLRIPSFTIENTHPDFFWLTNYVETVLSAEIWQASTTATLARAMRETLEVAAARTGTPPAAVDWQGHDFSYRGMSSNETAAMSGAAHLLSFTGTDSLVSIDWIERRYGGEFVAGSVPATEHSVMCAGIATVGERELFERLLHLYPNGIVSVVSDTFDLWRVLTEYLPALKQEVLARDGKLVIRPDSGDPVDILCGIEDEGHGVSTAERKGVIELLWDTFGGTVNAAGFRELDPHIGAIYGDSITRERAVRITERLAAKGFASGNVVFGMGSFGYQYQTRDTFMSAIKATWIRVDGRGVDIRKDPVTDSGTKKSATGRLAVVRDADARMRLIERATPAEEAESLLQTVWEDGAFVRRQTFSDIRAVLAAQTVLR
ncbi:nicotinamide phosphoribosyltransferase [Pseudoclavibacter sp. JAI123]|uniref:nicotinate phosphoribosyltransferase n=1 Tax=Pseudoclavibacter sp. JAI123 TaxID=2723065 RepID=UPI0015CB87BC|nr:nicotinate phosphoribosyltransferase [Pseudoclavibacter sp. JAI123]NYF13599.1 nicotinamide phosphoribosyltransferase [Pseudoclavibacter sp. JAI123]